MALEQSIVFRQLEEGSRFSQFDPFDGILALLPFNIHYLAALICGWSLGPPMVTLVAASAAVYFLRVKFPEGLSPLLQVLLTPHHLSALAEDQILRRPYPGASSRASSSGASSVSQRRP